jgi:hypothetical protein
VTSAGAAEIGLQAISEASWGTVLSFSDYTTESEVRDSILVSNVGGVSGKPRLFQTKA